VTKLTCEKCGAPATVVAFGEAHAEDAVYDGSLTSVRHEAHACAVHAPELEKAMKAKAEAQLARDLPIHRDMHRLQAERSVKYKALKDAVVARDEFLAANSVTEYDPKMKVDRLKWTGGDARQLQAEYERLHQLVRDADKATDDHEKEWSATVARGAAPVAT
jgi:hypothetical protein